MSPLPGRSTSRLVSPRLLVGIRSETDRWRFPSDLNSNLLSITSPKAGAARSPPPTDYPLLATFYRLTTADPTAGSQGKSVVAELAHSNDHDLVQIVRELRAARR